MRSDGDASARPGRGGTADATDLKSVDRKVVRVRFPPPGFHFRFSGVGATQTAEEVACLFASENWELTRRRKRLLVRIMSLKMTRARNLLSLLILLGAVTFIGIL